MRCTNHFKTIILALIIVSACAKRDNVSLVPSSAYGSTSCWLNERGEMVAFLVLAREGEIAVPYLISLRCLVDGTYSSDGEAVLHHLNTIRMLDLYGELQHSFTDVTLSDNLRSDQPVPSSNSIMYYFRAEVRRVRSKSKVVYAPYKLMNLNRLGITFEQFLELPRDQRQSLMKRPSESWTAGYWPTTQCELV